MPLTRDTVTHSSQVMLVVYPAFSLAIGLSYILGNPSRTSSPSFDVVRGLMPLPYWGLLFIGVAVLECVAWVVGRRDVMVFSLCMGVGVCSCWSFGFAASLIQELYRPGPPLASLTAMWIWGFVAIAHIATLRSLTRDTA